MGVTNSDYDYYIYFSNLQSYFLLMVFLNSILIGFSNNKDNSIH